MFQKKFKYFLSLSIMVILLTFTGCINSNNQPVSSEEKHWSYSGDTGPDYWHTLNVEYAIAKNGTSQSPINIITKDMIKDDNHNIPELHYLGTAFEVENNGHTIEIIPEAQENYINLDDEIYTLQQVHFHASSEHQIDGKYYDMEVHLVHKSESGKIAVIGILITEGEENQVLKELFSNLPKEVSKEGELITLSNEINLSDLLEKEGAMYRYEGSLTTPPCTEGVKWCISQIEIQFSAEQINTFKEIYSGNFRPVQALNGRIVYATSGEK